MSEPLAVQLADLKQATLANGRALGLIEAADIAARDGQIETAKNILAAASLPMMTIDELQMRTAATFRALGLKLEE